ncbi:helix-hairpin-helix domain-containing protein [Aquabacterium sp. A7-Y]|uniref:helix-hairpin-helix domain-containing protein n=1 Tax=Aquabacterium sp. A7-Y TaxID=1349605 RepID=UPI00223D4B5C|nr:helix-hairpin-helix domain-containing protein [Aquabacterium sp. A7-Y]MCW7541233.1 helix-hairpin-helix domain-containing protein [Aquabacterium sp. A7-Y]
MKALRHTDCLHATASLELIPNIGPALAEDLELLGIHTPRDLIGRDALVLYHELCARTGQRHDPCVLDTFMAAIDFMRGAPAAPWWHYTAQRKLLYGQARGTEPGADGPRRRGSAPPAG